MSDDGYRVVIDGIGDRTGSVASLPHPLSEAERGFDVAVDSFGKDIRDGNMRVSILAEAEYEKRPPR